MTPLLIFTGIILGFILPGLLVARLLNGKNDFGAAYIVSTVILFQIIFWTGIAGFKISIYSIGLQLLTINSILLLLLLKRGMPPDTRTTSEFRLSGKEKILLLPIFLSILLLFMKTSIFTLPHGDKDFRWFFLATKIIETGSFSYYPPLTPPEYEIYFFTEAFPPLVSFSYFWLFGLVGKTDPMLACIPTIFQYVFMFIFTYKLSSVLFGSRKHALISTLLLGTSPLLFYSLLITQETGLTALCSVSLVYFLLRNKSQPVQDIVLASFSASMGALSRDYGAIFVLFGVIIIIWKKMSLRNLIIFLFICTLLVAPWYMRTFFLTGNPFYSNPIGNLFPVNEVHAGILEGYKDSIGLQSYLTLKTLFPLASGLALVFGVPFFAGLISSILDFRKLGFFMVITLIMCMLWIYSIWIPAGLFHSMRILSPVIVLNSVCGAHLLLMISKMHDKAYKTVISILVVLCLVTLIQDTIVPCTPLQIRSKEDFLLASCIIPDPDNISEEILDLVQYLPDNSCVLTENPLYHAILAMNKDKSKGIRLVPIWSPVVKFLFGKSKSFNQSCGELEKLGIRYVLIGREGNLNMNYLGKYEFFRLYPLNAKPLDEKKKLFELPLVNGTSSPQ